MSYDATVLADSPVVFWPLNDVSGSTIADSSGNSHPGTITDSIAHTLGQASILPADSETSIAFVGADIVASTVPGPGTGAFALEIWMETTDSAQPMCLMNYNSGAAKFYCNAGSPQFNCGSNAITAGTNLHDGNPHHIVAVRRSVAGTMTMLLYIDGASVGTPVADSTDLTTSAPVEAAANGLGNQYFRSGNLQKFAFYNADLPAARITAHYNAGIGSASATITEQNLPSNHAGNITVHAVGSGTSWSSSTTWTASVVTGWSVASKTFVDSTHYTIVLTPPTAATPPAGATGTLTLTEGVTGSTAATTTVGTPTLALSPTTGFTGSTPTLTLTGTNTIWLAETAAGLFTESGGTGASIATPTVTTNTAATDVLTVGSATGTLTITDASTGATASFTASNTHTYDLTDTTVATVYIQIEGGMTLGTWHGSTAWGGIWNDQAVRTRATITQLDALVYNNGGPVRLAIDGVDTTLTTLPNTGGYAWVTVGTSLDGTAEHEYLLSGGQQLYIQEIRTTGGTINTARLPARPVLVGYGDSITQGDSGPSGADSTISWLHKAGLLLGMQVVNRGIFGTTVSNTVGTPSQTGQNRTSDVTSLLPPAAVIVIPYGVNDLNNSVSSGTFSAAYLDMLGKSQDGVPSTPIICERLLREAAGGTATDAFSSDIAAQVATIDNLLITYAEGMWGAYVGTEGIHPNATSCTAIAAALATDVTAVLTPPGGGIFANSFGGGFQ